MHAGKAVALMRAVHRRVATGRTDSALTRARGPSGCLRSCHRAHRLWAGRHASVPLCFCSSFSSAQTTPCHLSAGCSGPEGLFRTPFRFRLFEVRSAFCPRSLLVNHSHRRKGRFGGNQAQSNHRPSLGSRKSTRSDAFSLFSYKPLLRRCLHFLSWSIGTEIPTPRVLLSVSVRTALGASAYSLSHAGPDY